MFKKRRLLQKQLELLSEQSKYADRDELSNYSFAMARIYKAILLSTVFVSVFSATLAYFVICALV